MPLPLRPLHSLRTLCQAATVLAPLVFWCATGLLHPTPAFAQQGGAGDSSSKTAAQCARVTSTTEQMVLRILKIPKARLQPQLRLVEDLGANDQRLVDLSMQLEDDFWVELPDALADGSGTTMQAYVDALNKALGCAARG